MDGEEPPQEKKITRSKFERRSSWCLNNGSSDPSPVKSVAKERRLLTQPAPQLSPTARPDAKRRQRRGTCPSDLGKIGGWAEAECTKKDQSFSDGGSSQLISQNVALRRRFWMEARIDFQERKAALPSKTPSDLLRLAMEHTRRKVKGLLMRAKVVEAFRSYSVEQQELREAEAKAVQLAIQSELERVAVSDVSDMEDDERAKEEQEKRSKEMIVQIRLRHLVKVQPLVIDARLKLQHLQELVAAHKDDLESISSQMAETKRSMQNVLTRFESHMKNADLGDSVHTKILEINNMMTQLCKEIEDGDSLTIMQSLRSAMQATQHVGQAVTSEVSNCYGALGKKLELTEKKEKDVEKKNGVTQKRASSKEKIKEAVSALSRLKRVAKKVGVVSSMCKERKVEAEKEEVVVEKQNVETEKEEVVVEKENVENEKVKFVVQKENVENETEKVVVEKGKVGKGKAKVVLDKENVNSLRVKIVVEKENVENEKAKVPKRSSQARRTASILELASQKKTHRALLRDASSKVRQAIAVLKEERAMSAQPPAEHEDVAPSHEDAAPSHENAAPGHEDATPSHEYAASGRNLPKGRWKEAVNDMTSARKELEQEIQNLEGTHDAHLEGVDDEKVQLALSNIVLNMGERLEHHSDTLGDILQEFIHAHQEIQPDPREAMDSSDDIQPKAGEDSETHVDPESTQVSEPECIPATPELSDDADDACSEKSLGFDGESSPFDSESSPGLQSKPCETEVSSSNGESTVHACTPKLPPITPRRTSCPGTFAAVGAGTITGFCVGFLKSMLKPQEESSEDVGQATGQDADEAIACGRRHSMPVGRSVCPAQRFARSGQRLVEEKTPSLDSVPEIKLPEERKRPSRVFSKGSAGSSTSTSSSISTAASVKHRDQEPIRISNNRATESVSGSPLMNAWDKTLPQLPMEQPQTKKSPNRAHRRLSDIGRVSDPLESENCTTTEALPKTKIKNIGLQGQDISLEGKVPLSQNFLGLEISPPGVQRQAKRHDNFKSRLRERFAPAV